MEVWDPGHEERIQEIAARLRQDMQKEREKFSCSEFQSRLNCTKQELELAKREAFATYLERGWRDGQITAQERQSLQWAANRLNLPPGEAEHLQRQAARERFAASLAKAMDDGFVSDEEAAELALIARAVDNSLSEFVGQYFQQEGETFLRGVFAACTEGAMLADDAWARLLKTTQRLGISREDLSKAILPQAQRFIEHVIADAKSDGEFSEAEEKNLLQLVQTLNLPQPSRDYVKGVVSAFAVIRNAQQGKLPSITPPSGVATRAGEIVHLHTPAIWRQRRITKNEDTWDSHSGYLTITDNRLLFSSETKSFDVRFAKLVRHTGDTGFIRLQRADKPETIVQLNESEAIAYAILDGAISLANQTRRSKLEGMPTRHIPREVRQRVWQRYGGQCAECGAGDYLEFDHIIPVAKGGSNSDSNVQLLCRKCNLKKSDFI